MAKLPAIVCSVVKYEGGGGTRFWTTAPKPIAVISTDTNTDVTARQAFGMSDDDDYDEDICRFLQINMPMLAFDERDDVQDESEGKWEEMREFLRPLVKGNDDSVKTVVFDTANDVYDMRVFKEFGKKDQIAPDQRRNQMGRVNTSYKGIIQALKDRGLNVILVHRAKEKWIDKVIETQRGEVESRVKLNGPFDMERDGFKGTGFITEVEINLAFDQTRDGKLKDKYGMQITRCTRRPMLIGRKFWGHDVNNDVHKVSFPFLMAQIFKHTTVGDWT